jgi:hypothetical protein
MKLTIQIPDEAVSRLSPAFQKALADTQSATKLAEFALTELLGWLNGEKVYRSLTEQQIAWTDKCLQIVHPTTAPSAQLLFNEFGLPHGRSTYIARVLTEKRLSHWRQTARTELRNAMKKKEKEANRYIAEGDNFQQVTLVLTQAAYVELRALQAEAFSADNELPMLNVDSRLPELSRVGVPAKMFIAILTLLA